MGNHGSCPDKDRSKDKSSMGTGKGHQCLDESTKSSSSKAGVGGTPRCKHMTDLEMMDMFKNENCMKEKKFGKNIGRIREFNPRVCSSRI